MHGLFIGLTGIVLGVLVGLPGAKEGLAARDVTIAELLKARGYRTGQFGKNHLGDRDEHLPTAHGFDEFYGSLYHLNAEQEPEHPDYFKDPEMRKRITDLNSEPLGASREEMAAMVRRDSDIYGRIVKARNIRLD